MKELRRYRWSSYRAYIGREAAPPWLRCGVLLKRAGLNAQGYQRYVEQEIREGHMESPWEQLQGQVLLGGEAFVERLRHRLKGDRREQPSLRSLEPGATWEQIVAVVEGFKRGTWEQFRDRHGDWGRDLALWLAWKLGNFTLRQLGVKVGGIDYTSVSTALERFNERCRHDRCLAALRQRAGNQLPIERPSLFSLLERGKKSARCFLAERFLERSSGCGRKPGAP